MIASAAAKPATTTSLVVSSSGSLVTSVASGSVVALTAAVVSGTTRVTAGQVNFCDASAAYCTDTHILGTAQLTSAGTAVFKFRPGIGSHSYKAVFAGTIGDSSSTSNAIKLTVSGQYATTTTIVQTGIPGSYGLTATVAGIINIPGTSAPTGSVSFVDTTNKNSVLGTVAVSTGSVGQGFINSQVPITVPAGMGIATADFNGDGIADLAIGAANDDTTALSILLGNGDGTFTAASANPVVGYYPYSVLAGDFNSDGIQDLAVGNVDDNTITILIGKGNGTFTAQPNLSLTDSPQALATADFNRDGIPDLAVVLRTAVLIFDGNGDGTFHQITDVLGTGNVPTQGIAIGDLNGDGLADIVVAEDAGNGGVTVFLGKIDGTFDAGTNFGTGNTEISVAIGDFNQDGIPDLATVNYDNFTASVFIGNGDGTFQAPAPYHVPLINTQSVQVADFNGDGIADLAVSSGYPQSLAVLFGNGDGTFGTPVISSTEDFFYPSGNLAVADFNGDGLPDIAEPDQTSSDLVVFLDQQNVSVTATLNNVNPPGPGPHLVEASYPGDVLFNASISPTTSLTAAAATPTISPASGNYTSVQTVAISDATPGATIYYSASGTVNTNGFVPYTAPIALTLGGAEYIEAYASEAGYQDSIYTSANYYLNLPPAPAPVFSPAAGTYAGAQTVTITDAAPGAAIYYTTNGSLPTTSSTHYTGPISVTTSETVVAIAVASGYSTSPPASAQYIIASASSSFMYTLAGNGFYGYSGDGGPAQFANLNLPYSSVVDSAGNLYIADASSSVIRKVAAGTGIITTIAGTGTAGYSGDNGAAKSAQVGFPTGLSLDSAGNLYFADENNNAVRMITAATGIITTIAGNGTAGYSGDGGPASNSQLSYPSGTALDSSGNLYIADSGNSRIREIAKTGVITTVAGNGYTGYAGDGGPATAAQLGSPRGVTVDATGNLYIADTGNEVIRKVTASTAVISTVAGSNPSNGFGYQGGYSGDGGAATSAQLYQPQAVIVDGSGNLYIADTGNNAIRKVTASNGIINTIIGSGPTSGCVGFGGDGGPASAAAICYPTGISMDGTGNLYIADTSYSRVRVATAAALPPTTPTATPAVSVAAGTYASPQTVTLTDSTPGASIYLTTDGTTPTTLSSAYNGPIDASGNVTVKAIAVAPGYLISAPVSAAYTITSPPTSVIDTVAGTGVNGLAGAGGPAKSAQVGQVAAMAIDKAGDLFFTDTTNDVVWKVSATTGNIAIVAGNGTAGYSGDGGPATNAQLYYPSGVAVDAVGNLYIADSVNSVVRKVDSGTGLISTIAGVYDRGGYPIGDGGPATAAFLFYPQGLVVDAAGNLYIADTYNNEVRVVSSSSGIINAVAGNGNYGFSGEGGAATSASLGEPSTLAFDKAGNLYIGSRAIARVCKVTAATGILTTIAGGNASGSSGDGGPATSAEIDPAGIALDSSGNLYISNSPGAVRKVSTTTGVITKAVGNGYPGFSGDGGSAAAAQLDLPWGIAFDSSGNLFIADAGNHRVREVSTSTPTATPMISPASGTYNSSQMATITDSSKGATIYYTVDGTIPTNTSSVYSDPITLSSTTMLQAIAIAPGLGQSAVASATYTIQLPVAPTVTAVPSETSITTAQSMSVVVTVAGPSGNPPPTGSVTLSGGGYSSSVPSLTNGSAKFNLAAAALVVGADTLTAIYKPDSSSSSIYTGGTGSTPVITVTQAIGTATAILTLTPSTTTIIDTQSVNVVVSAAGATGQTAPTGSISLAGGSFNAQQSLASSSTTFNVPGSALSSGSNMLTASYSGDSTYATGSGTTSVTVSPAVLTLANPSAVAPGASASTMATLSAGSTYSGTIALTCTLSASPVSAQSPPTCSLNPASVTLAAGGSAKTTVTMNTTAGSGANALNTAKPGNYWRQWGGGGALAVVFLLGLPTSRRRRFAMFILFFVIAGAIGCGGGSGGGSTSTPGTTAGSYTFTVTGVDSSSSKTITSANLTLTVQ